MSSFTDCTLTGPQARQAFPQVPLDLAATAPLRDAIATLDHLACQG